MKYAVSLLVGAAIVIALVPVCALLYLRFGNPPVAVTDKPFPFEADIVKIPRHARIRHDEKASPLPASDENFISGAKIYTADCASCHGFKGRNAPFAEDMYPPAPNLWARHKVDDIGVSGDPVGETYWKVKYGIRLTGMPAFASLLTETQMWQVSLLLSNANKPLPAAAEQILSPPRGALQSSIDSDLRSGNVAASREK